MLLPSRALVVSVFLHRRCSLAESTIKVSIQKPSGALAQGFGGSDVERGCVINNKLDKVNSQIAAQHWSWLNAWIIKPLAHYCPKAAWSSVSSKGFMVRPIGSAARTANGSGQAVRNNKPVSSCDGQFHHGHTNISPHHTRAHALLDSYG